MLKVKILKSFGCYGDLIFYTVQWYKTCKIKIYKNYSNKKYLETSKFTSNIH